MTNETQKTGVEWYSRRLFEIEIAHNQGVINRDVYLKSKTHAFEQAKEMEKEQHEATALAMIEYALDNIEGKNNLNGKDAFEQHYNETYGGGNK